LFDKLRMDDLADKLQLSLSDATKHDKDAEPKLDEAEELKKKWKTAPDQIWAMGENKLICGDCTKPEVYERLMGEEKAQMAVTSPPYGVGKSYEEGGIQPWFDTIKPCIQNLCKYCGVIVWQLGDLYKTGGQFIEPTMVYSMNMFKENGFRPIWIRIWEKQGINFGTSPYWLISNKPAQQYEQIVAVAKEEVIKDLEESDMSEYEWVTAFAGKQHKFVKRLTRMDRKLWGYSGIWKIATVRANDKHPAMFPIELPKRCILMHSDEGGIVVEPFDGSGTTIIACENAGRKCRAIELDPKYVAVALQRYEDAFGKRPERIE